MKRLLIAALIVSTLCLPALAQKKGGDDFNDLIKRYYAAWSTLNPDNASFLYAKDIALVKPRGSVSNPPSRSGYCAACDVWATNCL